MAVERLADALGEHAAPAERDRAAAGPSEQVADQRLLAAAKLGLALGGEELGDRHPELGLEQLVGVEPLEPGGARGAQRRATCPLP